MVTCTLGKPLDCVGAFVTGRRIKPSVLWWSPDGRAVNWGKVWTNTKGSARRSCSVLYGHFVAQFPRDDLVGSEREKAIKRHTKNIKCFALHQMSKKELIGNSLDGNFFTFYIWIIIWKQILQLILSYCTNSLVKSRAQPKSAWLLAEDSCQNLDPFVLKSFFSLLLFFSFILLPPMTRQYRSQMTHSVCHVSWEENNQPVHFSSFSTVTRGVWKL